MKKVILATLFFCLCNSSITLSMDLDSGNSSKKHGFSLLKKIAKVALVGLLFFGNSEAMFPGLEPYTITELPYAPQLPSNTQTCSYEYEYHCKKPSSFSCQQQFELFCEFQIDENQLSNCYIREVCAKWWSSHRN